MTNQVCFDNTHQSTSFLSIRLSWRCSLSMVIESLSSSITIYHYHIILILLTIIRSTSDCLSICILSYFILSSSSWIYLPIYRRSINRSSHLLLFYLLSLYLNNLLYCKILLTYTVLY